MITFVETATKSKETTLNDIPIETTFRGEIQNDAKTQFLKGLYLKTHGPYNGNPCSNCGTIAHKDVFVIKLDGPPYYMWGRCAVVRNYEPVDVVATVIPVK